MGLNIENYKFRKIVIDTSVLIQLFLEEKNTDLVEKIVIAHKNMELALISTPLLVFEVMNILSKKLKDPIVVYSAFEHLKKIGISIMEIGELGVSFGTEMAGRYPKVSYYDAAYHGFAKEMDATFLTADSKYYEIVKEEGFIELIE